MLQAGSENGFESAENIEMSGKKIWAMVMISDG